MDISSFLALNTVQGCLKKMLNFSKTEKKTHINFSFHFERFLKCNAKEPMTEISINQVYALDSY